MSFGYNYSRSGCDLFARAKTAITCDSVRARSTLDNTYYQNIHERISLGGCWGGKTRFREKGLLNTNAESPGPYGINAKRMIRFLDSCLTSAS